MRAAGGTEFPALTTSRLRLRAPDIADAASFGAILSIPAVTRFSNWPDRPQPAQVERALGWMAKLHASGRGCAWLIEEAASNILVGAIRFNHFDRKSRFGEIGYESHPDFWGRGLMTEALCAVVACGHQMFRLNRIEAWTLPGNIASDRVLEKAGFRYEGTLRQRSWFKGEFHDFRMFGRLAGDPVA
jgi:ribosomal-protein-alanine N-acetyltransferase